MSDSPEKPKWRVFAKSTGNSNAQQPVGEYDTKREAAKVATERRVRSSPIVRNGRDYIITLPA